MHAPSSQAPATVWNPVRFSVGQTMDWVAYLLHGVLSCEDAYSETIAFSVDPSLPPGAQDSAVLTNPIQLCAPTPRKASSSDYGFLNTTDGLSTNFGRSGLCSAFRAVDDMASIPHATLTGDDDAHSRVNIPSSSDEEGNFNSLSTPPMPLCPTTGMTNAFLQHSSQDSFTSLEGALRFQQ